MYFIQHKLHINNILISLVFKKRSTVFNFNGTRIKTYLFHFGLDQKWDKIKYFQLYIFYNIKFKLTQKFFTIKFHITFVVWFQLLHPFPLPIPTSIPFLHKLFYIQTIQLYVPWIKRRYLYFGSC